MRERVAFLFLGVTLLLGQFFAGLPARADSASPHLGPVPNCTSCHFGTPSGALSLRGLDPSSTCLRCHAQSFRVFSRDGSAYTPGGDFFWLTRSYRLGNYSSLADSHGHNIIAVQYGLHADSRLPYGPSDGTVQYRSEWLSCTSCHDPHGTVSYDADYVQTSGNYRLLGGVGYNGGGMAYGISFTHPAPVARPYPPEGDQWPAETDTNHVDYGSGMSEWCANCHSGFDVGLNGPSDVHRHPSGNGAYLESLSAFYNSYLASGDLEGRSASAFDHLVPFERGETNPGSLDYRSTEGPGANANVMCLSCHRAHASPFSFIGRWDFQVVFLKNSPVLSSPQALKAYYGERIQDRYNGHQRSLCNKCHHMD